MIFVDYKRTKRKLIIKKYIKEVIGVSIGCAIMAIGTSFFLLPNQLSSGGFTGIATILYYLCNIPLGMGLLLLNIPLLIFAFFRNGKELFIKSIIGTGILSFFLDLFEQFPPLTQDRLLACIYGGIAMGIGTAIILKVGASTGGSDLLSYVIRSYKPYYRSSNLIVIIDIIIITLNVIFFKEIEIGLYSAIAIYLMGKMVDIVFEGVYFTKILFIISPQYKKIADVVGRKVDRGSTGIYAKGMYTREKRMMLMCVGTRNEIAKIKQIATRMDPKAFIIIMNAREAWGKGFKKV